MPLHKQGDAEARGQGSTEGSLHGLERSVASQKASVNRKGLRAAEKARPEERAVASIPRQIAGEDQQNEREVG